MNLPDEHDPPHWVEAEEWLEKNYPNPGQTWNVYKWSDVIAIRYDTDDDSWCLNGHIEHEYFRKLVIKNDFDTAMHALVKKIKLDNKSIMKGMTI